MSLQQTATDFSVVLPFIHFLPLNQSWVAKAFPGQPRNIFPPACPGSSRGDMLRTPL